MQCMGNGNGGRRYLGRGIGCGMVQRVTSSWYHVDGSGLASEEMMEAWGMECEGVGEEDGEKGAVPGVGESGSG